MNTTKMRLLGMVSTLLATVVTDAGADDWHCWRGPHGTGISNESDWTTDWPAGKPRIAWTAEVGTGFSSCVVQGTQLLTMGHAEQSDRVICLDVDDGKVVWEFAYPAALDDRDFEGGPTSTPTIDGDRVYVLSRAGELFCLELATGRLRWQKQVAEEAQVRVPGWGFSAAPFVIGDRLLLTLGESGAALNKHDGSLLWSSDDKECGYATPVLLSDGGRTTAVFASGRAFSGVDLETGQKRWTERWLTSFGCNAADPIVHDGKLFLSSGYNRGAALFQFVDGQPEVVWKNKEMQNQLHSSLLYEGYLYGIDGNMEFEPRLRCMEWSTGKVMWSIDDLQPGGLAMADGKLLLLTETGELVIAPAQPTGFNEVARGKVMDSKCWTIPVLSGGRLFCRSIGGQVACVDLRR
jgi:outer membrane protein assembly factor BamB